VSGPIRKIPCIPDSTGRPDASAARREIGALDPPRLQQDPATTRPGGHLVWTDAGRTRPRARRMKRRTNDEGGLQALIQARSRLVRSMARGSHARPTAWRVPWTTWIGHVEQRRDESQPVASRSASYEIPYRVEVCQSLRAGSVRKRTPRAGLAPTRSPARSVQPVRPAQTRSPRLCEIFLE
jgi:hypothetical protein